MYYEELKKNLFVTVDYPKEITKLIGSTEPWKEFCALPLETKKKFEFISHQEGADPGYRLRSRSEGREDKEYFHIYPNAFDLIEKDGNTKLVHEDPTLKNFFEYSVEVQCIAHDFAVAMAKEMGKEIPELREVVKNNQIRSVLRLLHYTNDKDTDVIADQHFDRSIFTLHLYESGPGLQFLNWDMKWTEGPIDTGKTLVFNGYRMEMMTKGKLQKTWHRVVRKDDAKDRLSTVLFVWTDAVSDYGRELRSQDLKPGYTT